MISLKVFCCRNGHTINANEKPALCEKCGSSIIKEIEGVTVSKETSDVTTKKSKYRNR